jgi:hypothetical protein
VLAEGIYIPITQSRHTSSDLVELDTLFASIPLKHEHR